MNCSKCEELMSDYLEGAAVPAQRQAIDSHLRTCAACSELIAGMTTVMGLGKTFPVYEAPAALQSRIIANVPVSTCANCEELMSDYLEGALAQTVRHAVDLHFSSCDACSELFANMGKLLDWGKTFPVHEAPAWLPSRIIANTPRVERERWIDTIAAVAKWVVGPRVAMGVFTATLMLGWLGNVAGISPNWTTVVRNPTAIYYEAQGAVNRAYDEAVRRYYRSPLVSGLRSRIEQLREIS